MFYLNWLKFNEDSIKVFWQKVSHRVYTLQDAYLGRTPTTPLKNAMQVNRSSFIIANSS
jgi:hypothetical protein